MGVALCLCGILLPFTLLLVPLTTSPPQALEHNFRQLSSRLENFMLQYQESYQIESECACVHVKGTKPEQAFFWGSSLSVIHWLQ